MSMSSETYSKHTYKSLLLSQTLDFRCVSSLHVYSSHASITTEVQQNRKKARKGECFAGIRFENTSGHLCSPCSLPPLTSLQVQPEPDQIIHHPPKIIVTTLTTVHCLQAKLKTRIKIFLKTGSNICSFGDYLMMSKTQLLKGKVTIFMQKI